MVLLVRGQEAGLEEQGGGVGHPEIRKLPPSQEQEGNWEVVFPGDREVSSTLEDVSESARTSAGATAPIGGSPANSSAF